MANLDLTLMAIACFGDREVPAPIHDLQRGHCWVAILLGDAEMSTDTRTRGPQSTTESLTQIVLIVSIGHNIDVDLCRKCR